MFPLGVAKSSQGGLDSQNFASRSGVVAGAETVEPDGVVVPGGVAVVAGVETVTVTVVVGPVTVDELPDAPHAAVTSTTRRMPSQR
jgi:hypothetical protein